MKIQSSILGYFEKTIKSIKKMEENAEIFSELKNISGELQLLEQQIITTFNTLDNNFNSFVKHINLLSEIIDFQRSVVSFKKSENMMSTMFDFLHRNVRFNHSFIAFKIKDDDEEYTIVSNRNDLLGQYQKFVSTPEMSILNSIVQERDMAYLISDARQFHSDEIQWDLIDARSLILFPIKVRGKALGIGMMIRQDDLFEINDLSFVNLNIGIISLLVYQHYYFARLKSRLFKQYRLRKIVEEVKYAEYFEKGPLFIFTLDPRNVVLHANTAALSSLDVNEDAIIGENFLDIIPPAHKTQFNQVLKNSEEGKIQYYRSPVLNDTPLNPILEFYVSRIELQNHFSLILVFAVDVTQNFYRDQLEQRNNMLDELDQFSRTLVSEFNNLLTIMVPNISLLRTSMLENNPYQKQLMTMENAAQRSANMIQKFLNFDLEEFESLELGNPNKILKSYTDALKTEVPAEVALKLKLDPGMRDIKYYPLRLRQLLKLLVENSLNAVAGRDGAEIVFSTNYVRIANNGLVGKKSFYLNAGEYAEICVRDNGIGISEKSLSQIFKPFYSTRIKNEGVGLGLFIAYNIVKDMRGQIFVDSKIDEFTSVSIYLPVKEIKEMDVGKTENAPVEKKKTNHRPTVLVVDDEYNIRSMMKEIMEMYGFKVFTAGNGRDGVDVYERNISEIDLVILDMVMPVMDGRAAFIEMKKINPEQKIFIISGYSQREDLDEILQKGAVGFMRKPFQVHELTNKIKEILKLKG